MVTDWPLIIDNAGGEIRPPGGLKDLKRFKEIWISFESLNIILKFP